MKLDGKFTPRVMTSCYVDTYTQQDSPVNRRTPKGQTSKDSRPRDRDLRNGGNLAGNINRKIHLRPDIDDDAPAPAEHAKAEADSKHLQLLPHLIYPRISGRLMEGQRNATQRNAINSTGDEPLARHTKTQPRTQRDASANQAFVQPLETPRQILCYAAAVCHGHGYQ